MIVLLSLGCFHFQVVKRQIIKMLIVCWKAAYGADSRFFLCMCSWIGIWTNIDKLLNFERKDFLFFSFHSKMIWVFFNLYFIWFVCTTKQLKRQLQIFIFILLFYNNFHLLVSLNYISESFIPVGILTIFHTTLACNSVIFFLHFLKKQIIRNEWKTYDYYYSMHRQSMKVPTWDKCIIIIKIKRNWEEKRGKVDSHDLN